MSAAKPSAALHVLYAAKVTAAERHHGADTKHARAFWLNLAAELGDGIDRELRAALDDRGAAERAACAKTGAE